MKILSPRVHGYLDYGVVLLLALAPMLFGFGGIAATLCYVLAAVQFGMSIMTNYPLGLAKVIPFTVHGGIEFITSFGLALAPWLFGFSHVDAARNFFLGSAIALFGVWMTTNYKAADRETTRGGAYYGRQSYS